MIAMESPNLNYALMWDGEGTSRRSKVRRSSSFWFSMRAFCIETGDFKETYAAGVEGWGFDSMVDRLH